MGIFARYLHELQVNGQTVGDEDNFTVDGGADVGAEDPTAAPADQADDAADTDVGDEDDDFTLDETDEEDLDDTEGDTDETQDEDQTTEDDADDDFTVEDPEGGEEEGGDDTTGDETPADDTTTDNTSSDPSNNISDDDARQAEEQIYDSLTDNQKRIRVLQLKIDYRDLYETIENTLDGINRIPKNSENIETYTRLVSALTKMKSILIDYINNNFDQNSYLENYTMYIKYMAAFRTVSKVIEEINKATE